MLKEVRYPPYLIDNGITGSKRGYEGEWLVCGANTETVRGEPYCLQFAFAPDDVRMLDVSPATILNTFAAEVSEWAQRARPRQPMAVFFHNLRFDLQAILYNHRHLFGQPRRDFAIELDDGARLHAYTDKIWFARLHLPNRRVVWILDSRAFFLGSLDKVSRMVGSPYKKLPHPKGLGTRKLSGPAFERYARNDVLAEWHVARAIHKMHADWDVRLSVSAPHFASRVFRQHFLKRLAFGFPPAEIARAAELAYHGGKNQMSVRPGWYKRCWEWDINSAYTAAMRDLPSFVAGTYRAVREVPRGEHGVVCVSGRVHCPYGILFTHDFKPLTGEFENVWTTTYELDEAVRCREVDVRRVRGWTWHAKRGSPSPLREYAQRFWKLKLDMGKEGKGSIGYNTAKLLSNSLYGKFVQTVREVQEVELTGDGDARVVETWRAGGLYHPFLACLITGRVRAQLHRMEHAARSLHSSTDSVKTQTSERDLREFRGDGLGQWSVELGPSNLLLLRTKLYVHEPSAPGGKVKYALHGFQGDLDALLRAAGDPLKPGPVLRGRRFAYLARHCWSHREALIRTGKPVIPLNIENRKLFLAPVAGTPEVDFPHAI